MIYSHHHRLSAIDTHAAIFAARVAELVVLCVLPCIRQNNFNKIQWSKDRRNIFMGNYILSIQFFVVIAIVFMPFLAFILRVIFFILVAADSHHIFF